MSLTNETDIKLSHLEGGELFIVSIQECFLNKMEGTTRFNTHIAESFTSLGEVIKYFKETYSCFKDRVHIYPDGHHMVLYKESKIVRGTTLRYFDYIKVFHTSTSVLKTREIFGY